MNDLLLHPKTRVILESLASSPPHSLLIIGKSGSQKQTVVGNLAARVLSIDYAELDKYPYLLSIDNPDSGVTIEDIRSIQNFLKLKVPRKDDSRQLSRIVIINRADTMKAEAQNALLKTLEEPPSDTMVILTTSNRDHLLATIKSRVQEVTLLPVSQSIANQFYKAKNTLPDNFEMIFALSQGQPGLIEALLSNNDHPLLDNVRQAKKILSEKKGERLLHVDEITKDKQNVRQLLDALLRITHAALVASSKKNDLKSINRWQNSQKLVIQSIKYFDANVQPKLVLDNLFISI